MNYDACALEEIDDGAKKVVSVGGRMVLLLRKGDEVWAVDPKCPHMKLPLKSGEWDGKTIKCRYHGACYCADDGTRVKTAWLLGSIGRGNLGTYPVTIEGGRVFVATAGRQ